MLLCPFFVKVRSHQSGLEIGEEIDFLVVVRRPREKFRREPERIVELSMNVGRPHLLNAPADEREVPRSARPFLLIRTIDLRESHQEYFIPVFQQFKDPENRLLCLLQ